MSAILLYVAIGLVLLAPQAVIVQEPAQSTPDPTANQSIESLLTSQVQFWNDKNIEGFMTTYWKSSELTFSGGGKTTRGWKATLNRYKTKYPPEKMGTLNFSGLEVTVLSKDVAMVLGNWNLNWPDKPEAEGNFSLVLKKMNNEWKIIHDHSSTLEN